MRRQNNQRRQFILLTTIATIFLLCASVSTLAQKGEGARFGARDPRTCADTKSPTRGAITAAQAAKYIICNREYASHDYLGLVEDVTVQVGAAVPYNRRTNSSAADIDTQAPIYPVRASLKSYTCGAVSDIENNKGRNCTINNEPQAKGICYKTTFGDWNCNAASIDLDPLKGEHHMPPPGGATAVPDTDKPVASMKNGPTVTRDKQPAVAKANDDENADFPKPDFSAMEKFYDIVKYDYDILKGRLSFVANLKKENNTASWLIDFYDADGVPLMHENYVVPLGSDYKIGQPVKFYADTPSESVMKRVKKVVISRNIP